MADKITLSDLTNLQNETSATNVLNSNFEIIEDAIQNTLSRDGTAPNAMGATLDMNSNRIINLPEPVSDTEPVRKDAFDDLEAATVTVAADAAASAAAALVSANNADASEAATAALLDEFDDIYLGAKSASPSLDNDGDPLATGALYFDTDDDLMYTWTGATWVVTFNPSTSAVDSVFGRTGTVSAANGDYTAGQVTNVAAGNLSSITVQAAINELDTEKQPVDATLTALAGVTVAADKVIYATGADAFATTDLPAFGRTLIANTTAADARTDLEVVIGTNVQAWDEELDALASVTSASNALPYFTALGNATTTTLTSFGRSIIDDIDEATFKATVNLEIGTDVQAFDQALADISGLAITDGNIIVADGTNWIAESGDTARTSLGVGTGNSPEFTAVNIGDATDTTITRTGAGDIAVEGNLLYRAGGTDVPLADGGTGASLADPGLDLVMAWDDSAAAVKFMPLADMTAEAAPAAGDYILMYGAEGDLRKVNWDDLPGAGAGISNVLEDTSPQLGGDLDANTFNIGFDTGDGITDEAGNEQLMFTATASAVNQFNMTNAATGNGVLLSAAGGDTDINIRIGPKGAGQLAIEAPTLLSEVTVPGTPAADKIVLYAKSTGSQTTVHLKDDNAEISNVGALPRAYIAGLHISNNGSDTTNDVDIGTGSARDSTDVVNIVLGSGLTKRLDAAWAVGTAAGMLDGTESVGGTPDVSTWYHLYAIKRSDTGVVDVVASENATTPTLPTNYDYYRRIGAVYNDASGNIVQFTRKSNRYQFTQLETLVFDVTNLTSTRQTPTAIAPPNTVAVLRCHALHATSALVLICPTTEPDATVGGTAWPLYNFRASTAQAGDIEVAVDASSQFAVKANTSSTTLRILTIGYTDNRGSGE